MNRLCPRIVLALYALAVLVFLYAAFGSVANVLQWAVVGLALAAFATLFKALCCDCPKKG